MKTLKRVIAPAALLLVLVFAASACDKQELGNWQRTIKGNTEQCNFRGKNVMGQGWVQNVDVHCYFKGSTTSSEHPYVLVYISGCDGYRINGPANGDAPLVNLSCYADPFPNISFKACMTHGGPAPDDCTQPADSFDFSTMS